uniref:AIPP2-like SPOC-like domain-containing protein n=1 Tax=Oryza brachyantha TaxID=4533 RepID=J3LLD4_ORYBR
MLASATRHRGLRRREDTACPTCGDRIGSENVIRCQCKKSPEHEKHEVYHANDAMLEAKGFSRPNSSRKKRMHKSPGGTYSKPDARVKIIPAEEITYVRHGKLYGKTVGSAGLQKRHCRRSVTPPPSSRKVSLVTPTVANQKPTTPVSPAASCISWPERAENGHSVATPCLSPNWTGTTENCRSLDTACISPNWPGTAENGHSLVGGYMTNSLTTQIASLLKRPSPICRAVLSQPSGTSLRTEATAPKNLSRSDSREAFVKSCSSRAFPAHVLAAHSTIVSPGTNAEPSTESFCAPGNENSPTNCNLGTLQCQGTRTAVAPSVQKTLTMEPVPSPKSVLSEKPNEACPDTASRPPSRPNLFDGKCMLGSLQSEAIIPPTQSPQSTSHARCVELSEDFEAVPSTKSHISTEKQTNQETPITCNVSSDTPVILHTKLHKKHYQPEACWKGKFEVTGELTHICDGLEAHFPFEISVKVYEASKLMPEVLKLEAIPLSHLWPKTFKMKPPEGQDIGLCFISSPQRPNGNSDHLLKNISSHIGLRTKIGAAELLIFSSKLLTQEYQRKCGQCYFWGVFRELHRSRHSLDVPPGFTKANRLPHTGETTEPCIDPSGSKALDSPPGFPLDIPPGFTEAQRQPIVIPGFTKLLEVKQEPGLPPSENIASTGKANEIKSKFQEEPENQTQGGKRDHPESPEPSAADAFKPLKVNGRIDLNRIMDRRTLNSQPSSREGLVHIQVSGPTAVSGDAAIAGNVSGDACVVCYEEFPTQ